MKIVGLVIVVLALALSSDIWRLAAREDLAAGKAIALALAALVLIAYSFFTARSASSFFRALLWPMAAAAAAALFQALFFGMRVQWGAACNGCDPVLGLIVWPLAGGAAGLVSAVPFAWYYAHRSTRAAV